MVLGRWVRHLLFKKRNQFVSRWLVLAIDITLTVGTFLLAYFIRLNFDFSSKEWTKVALEIPFATIIYVAGFFAFRSFYGIIRHTSIRDIYKIIQSTTLSALILLAAIAIGRSVEFRYFESISVSAVLIHYLITVFVLTASRFFFKTVYFEITSNRNNRNRILIYGAGKLGTITKNSLSQSNQYQSIVLGFIDENPSIIGKFMEGLPVYSPEQALDPKFIERKGVSEIILAIQKISSDKKHKIIDRMLPLSVAIKNVPPVQNWINGELTANQIRKVNIEDLLGREAIKLGKKNILSEVQGKTILITGACGSIGSEIVMQCLYAKPKALYLIDQSESGLFELEHEVIGVLRKIQSPIRIEVVVADIRNQSRMDLLFKEARPDIVYHAAAYKHVPLMEKFPYEAISTNVFGTKTLADLSVKYAVKKFVMVSTDKAVNPTNVMGASKRLAEMYVQSLDAFLRHREMVGPGFITTRFGNVLGSNGSVIPLFQKQIQNGGPLTVTHPDIMRYFMTIPEACQLVLEASALGHGGEIFIFDMGESVRIVDLARKMIRLCGLTPDKDIKIEFSGLRDGEKLFEELLNDKENTLPTHHPKIMVAKVRESDHELLRDQLIRLQDALKLQDEELMVSMLKVLIPEFISNSSRFEKLDINPQFQ